MERRVRHLPAALAFVLSLLGVPSPVGHAALAETCTTQSEMPPTDRDRLVGPCSCLRRRSGQRRRWPGALCAGVRQDPGPMSGLVAGVAPRLKDASLSSNRCICWMPAAQAWRRRQARRCRVLLRSEPIPGSRPTSLSPASRPAAMASSIVHAPVGQTPWSLSFLLSRSVAG